MKTLVSATLLTILAGTSAAFALPPIPSNIDTGYSDKEQAGDNASYGLSSHQAEVYKVDAGASLTMLKRSHLEH